MSKERPDAYTGAINSDKYTIEAADNKYEEYSAPLSSGFGPGGILSNKDELNTSKNMTVESDDNYYKEVYGLYSNLLNASGMNLLDPYTAYLTHFNKLQRRHIDPPYLGKTYIFITRPDLNFWEVPTGIHNVENVDLFSYFSRMNIGVSVMPWLMFPHNMRMEFKESKVSDTCYRAKRNRIGSIELFKGDMGESSIKNNSFTPFIPLLSNFCTSSSGSSALTLDTKETEGDLHGNKLQYAKGADNSFAPTEITLEFSDIYGSPIMHLFNIWVHYMHYLTKGLVNTWSRYVQYRIIDYTCSIYVFETDKDNSTILRWVKYTGCFPKSVPTDNIQHNLEASVDQLRNLSIPFAVNRVESMKPAALNDFNFIMNKFIFDSDKTSQSWLYSTGVAPRKLILPYKDFEINKILEKDSAINPAHYEYIKENDRNTKRQIVDNDTNYYDNKFWGAIPYIINHKLVWLDPAIIKKNFEYINNKKSQIDRAIRRTQEDMLR